MHRIDGAGHVDHLFVAEDPATLRPPTEITPEIMNAFQEELATFIEWAGIALAKGDNTQLRQALVAKFAGLDVAATKAGVQGQTYTAFTTAGATGAFTLTPVPAIAAYAAGQRFRVKFHAAGNGSDKLNVCALGDKNLKQYDSTGTKVAAVIAANQLADVEFDGADMVILDPLPVSGSKRSQLFLSNGSFTVPSGVTTVYVSMCGGGGSGGNSAGVSGGGGGGGGAQAYRGQAVVVTSGQVITVTVGSGGAGTADGVNGNAGGTTSFGALLTAAGGGGGTAGGTAGTAGGSGGQAGQAASFSSNAGSGNGGGCLFGAGGSSGQVVNGMAGSGYGAGGGGCDGASGMTSGAGAPGFILVEW